MNVVNRLPLLALAAVCGPTFAQFDPPRIARTPTIHGDRIAFASEGDLWLGSISSGSASRITSHAGAEDRPVFSPDGKWLAFTGQYDGGNDIYVMPSAGGAPKRVTYDPSGATCLGWTPDGTRVLFRSGRLSPATGQRLYTISATGGFPDPLPMEKAAQGSFSPDGSKIAFCRMPLENHRWKRYKGGQMNQVWIGDLTAKTYRRITDNTINEQYPVWIGNTIYYVSEKDGTANLWRFDTTSGRALKVTRHADYDVRNPQSDGKRIVYEFGGNLQLYDVATGQTGPISIKAATDRIHARPITIPAQLMEFSPGPTGKRIAVASRGQIFNAPSESGEIRPVVTDIGARAQSISWSPDGKWIAFVSDKTGEQNVWVAPAAGDGQSQKLTNLSQRILGSLAWSPDSKKIVYTDNTDSIQLLDVASKALTQIDQGYYGISQPTFSPDSKWLAYTKGENYFVTNIVLKNLSSGAAHVISRRPFKDHSPEFDPTGKYLYFFSDRAISPNWDAIDFEMGTEKVTKVYMLTLAKITASPLRITSDEEPATQPPAPKPAEAADAPKETKIDLDGLMDRIIELPIPSGSYSSPLATEGKLLFRTEEGALMAFDLAAKKLQELAQGVGGYVLSGDGKKLAVFIGGGLSIVDAGAPFSAGQGRVDLSGWTVTVDPEAEWRQIFLEAWRTIRDLFYDPNLHGMDWGAVKRRYEALLPAVGSRQELTDLIGQMQAEVNVSHMFSGGGFTRNPAAASPQVAALGADFVWDAAAKAARITRIYGGDGFDSSARSPLLEPGMGVTVGSFVFAVNGAPVTPDREFNALLYGLSSKTTTLLVGESSDKSKARIIRLKPRASDAQARYYGWAEWNRAYVEKNGGGKLGYVQIPDMGEEGMAEVFKHLYANLDKEGLVIDVRYNGGGITSGLVLERLKRVVFEYDQARYGAPMPYHRMGVTGKIILLCNEGTGSDGEYFSTGFRAMKLGKSVGTRTWGGFAAVSGFSTVDGGFVSCPVQGSFTPDGKWLPDGYGFNPDYVVDEDPNAFQAGRDPQLDKAIELILADIKKNPRKPVQRLEPPTKAKAFPPNKP